MADVPGDQVSPAREVPGEEEGTQAEETLGEAAPEAPEAGSTPVEAVLRGTPVAPGMAVGVVHLKDYELDQTSLDRVPRDQVENELNRFHRALLDARAQLAELKGNLMGKVPLDDTRILDVHVAYLKDSVFISDVENLILNEQLSLEASIAKVITDFDRIFRLVRNETLRDRAVDLRDVGIRVLRHLEQNTDPDAAARTPPEDYVLVAKELSIVDMFNLRGDHVLAILTEEGGLTSHAGILARSMRIPTLTGVEGLLETAREGDRAIVDAAEGVVRLNPDEAVIAQYTEASGAADAPIARETPAWATREPRTLDGRAVRVSASCGSLPEIEQAVALDMAAIGLYRTELLYLLEKEPPTRDHLLQHYANVLRTAEGAPVTFRLLHVDSTAEVGYLHAAREVNPALGRAGIRALFSREEVLRRQLQAILCASLDAPARISIPFVTDTGELRRVREVLFEERLELKKTGDPFQDRVELGAVIETPAAMLGAGDLAEESDFVVLGLDAFLQHVLAADRENMELREYFEALHPYVLRALKGIVGACREHATPLAVFGVTAVQPHNLPFLVGLGIEEFIVPPANLQEFLAELGQIDASSAERAASAAAASSSRADALSLVDVYRHGYGRSD